jgi:glycosyltransferase involved in cell wall biosynthesis
MTNIAFFKSIHQSHWESLKISFPLIYKYYEALNYQAIEVNKSYPTVLDSYEELIFIDHHPHPLEFFLKNTKILESNAKYTFHIYGDFFLYLDKWNELFKLLQGKEVCIITCSKAHQDFIRNFINGADYQIMPHLLDDKSFSSQNNVFEYDFIFCGRVTCQKNVDSILRSFIKIKKVYPKLKMAIVGAIDNYGYHYLGKDFIQNDDFVKSIKKLKMIARDVEFIGKVDNSEIPALLSKSKYLISPSTFHEEDFGRVVPEAMALGCLPLLSSWGGYNDFIQKFDLPKMIQPQVDQSGIVKVSDDEVYQGMENVLSLNIDREQLIANCQSEYLLSSFIRKKPKRKFKEIKNIRDLMKECLEVYVKGYGPVFENKRELQEKVYACYQD